MNRHDNHYEKRHDLSLITIRVCRCRQCKAGKRSLSTNSRRQRKRYINKLRRKGKHDVYSFFYD